MDNDTHGDIGPALAALAAAPVIVFMVRWVLLAVVAAFVAPEGRGETFFLLTFLFLGPRSPDGCARIL
jgi:hypothetical protein